jgi:hypothetical protein
MGTLQKVVIRLGVVLFWSSVLSACASRLWIASTKFNTLDYKNSTVLILPTVVNPAYVDAKLPIERIEQAVAEEFDSLGVHMGARPHIITPEQLQTAGLRAQFPYTPGQLAKIGASLPSHPDAVIGISVMASSTSKKPATEASVDLLITFVDVHSAVTSSGNLTTADKSASRNVPASAPTKFWILSGSWTAHSTDELPEALQASLGFHFIDVKWVGRASLNPWGSTQVFSPDDPLVTISSPLPNLGDDKSLERRSIPIVATGIYEGGIASLRITNARTNFNSTLFSNNAKPSGKTNANSGDPTDPVFLSSPVSVPIAKGRNKIIVSAIGSNTREGHRVLKVTSIADRKIHVLPIAVAQYKEYAIARSGARAMDEVREAASRNSNIELEDTRDLKPTKYELADAVQGLADNAGVEDPAVIVFSGRIAKGSIPTIDGAPKETFFLLMHDSSRAYPGIGSISLEEVVNVLSPRWAIVLDVCTDEDIPSMQNDLRKSLPPGSIAHVDNCRGTGGDKTVLAVAKWIQKQSDSSYPQSILSLLSTVLQKVPDVIVVPPSGATIIRKMP